MKKVFALMLVCVCAFAVAACGDDDDGGSVDNVAACQEAEDSLNELECLTVDFDYSCDSYDGVTCDYSEYFTCLADLYTCEGDVLTWDEDQYDECMAEYDELVDSCS